jgi:hypothetical protein
MRRAALTLASVAVFALCGCSTDENPKGWKLSLLKPMDQTLRRGATNKIAITVVRSGFDGEVDVEFEDLPAGVKVIEDERIPGNENIRNFTLHAGNDADIVGNHVARVRVRGPKGTNLETSETFQINVKA